MSLPLARKGAEVLTIDVSVAMVARLRWLAGRNEVPGLAAAVIPIEQLAMLPASVDLVVSAAGTGMPGVHGRVDVDAGSGGFANVTATTIVAEAGLVTADARPAKRAGRMARHMRPEEQLR